jgi:hypothetical protein
LSTRIPEQHAVAADTAEGFHASVSADGALARPVYGRHGIQTTDAFVGLDLMGHASDGARLRNAVVAAPGSSVEVMTHPGYVGTGWDEFNASPAREHELRVLLARPLQPLVHAGRAALVAFRGRA